MKNKEHSEGYRRRPLKFIRSLLYFQTIYYFITALWPLVSINSFMRVTGPKTDVWLVKTVAVLILVIAITLLYGLVFKANAGAVMVLAISSCIALGAIECYYAINNVISDIYLADAVLELLLVLLYITSLAVWLARRPPVIQ